MILKSVLNSISEPATQYGVFSGDIFVIEFIYEMNYS